MFKPPKIPTKPGIYKFFDNQGRLLYIGKAKNLKHRVKSYFTKSNARRSFSEGVSPVKIQMVQQINKVEYILVGNENEAMILERNLIKKYQPPFNVDLKDDKSWLYAVITNEEYPKIILIRYKKQILNNKKNSNSKNQFSNYFGPYTSATAIRETLKMLKKIFPYYAPDGPARRSFSGGGPMIDLSKNHRSHLHLGRYLNKPVTDKKEWKKNIKLIKKFLNGKIEDFKIVLENKMKAAAKKKNFEQAGLIRDQLRALAIIGQKQQVLKNNEIDENYLIKIRKNFQALEQLKKILKLKQSPLRIEAYDISNIGGQMAVGSLVVLTDGEIDTSQYRHFKIKTVKGANDPAMMAEVIKRRLKNDWPLPDLMLIDGGPTQLNAASAELKKTGLKLPIVSLAKKQEEIYLPNESIPIKLPKFSPALQLLQRIRDEAHRFAINYYRKLHTKKLLTN
ncbi:MAG: GIY-YIG nuclease family protein [Candidatus Komeilibacteria bacterium]|nr:GIY-YIG nuclease family protein [Candidatus Komeilibacteria bacterium]